MERTKKIVIIDASVVTKWFVEETNTKKALQIREDYRRNMIDLRSSQLMPFEVLNALRHNPELGQKEIERAGDAISRYQIALYPLQGELIPLCIGTALKYGLTIYDASYVSLSQFLVKALFTADEKLLSKTKDLGMVHSLKEYPG